MELVKQELTKSGRKETYLIPGTTNKLILEGNMYYLINEKGKAITKRFDKVSDFENGIAVFSRKDKKGAINTSGKNVLGRLYDNVALDNDIIRVCEDGEWGFANLKGEIIYAPVFSFLERFTGEYARFSYDDNLWGIVRKNGTIVIDAKYQYLSGLDKPVIIAKNCCGYGAIDITDKVIEPFKYDRIHFDGKTNVIYNPGGDSFTI